MDILIGIGVFVLFIVIWGIYSKKAVVKELLVSDGENKVSEYDKLRVTLKSMGPKQTILIGCKMVLTDQRAIIAQKIPITKKYKIMYYLWHNQKGDKTTGMTQSISNYQIPKEQFVVNDNTIVITPSSDNVMKKITIEGFENVSGSLFNE